MSTLQEIQARAVAATEGPWHWSGNTDSRHLALSYWSRAIGRCHVMSFGRWGMQGATPMFRAAPDDWFMRPAHENAIYEVAPAATSRNDPKVYRADVVGFRHPDAVFIAHSRQDVDDLLAVIAAVEAVCDEYEPMNARNDDIRFGADAVLRAVREAIGPGLAHTWTHHCADIGCDMYGELVGSQHSHGSAQPADPEPEVQTITTVQVAGGVL